MRQRLFGAVLLGIILFLAGGIVTQLAAPRLLSVSPAAGAAGLPANTPLRLTFSRAMNETSLRSQLAITPAQEGDFTWEGLTLVFTPAGRWPNGQTITVQLKAGARAAGLLPLLRASEWSFSVRDPQILFLYPADGPSGLYAVDPLTQAQQRLTDPGLEVLDFSLGPGDETIYYSARDAEGSSIYRLEWALGSADPRAQSTLALSCPQALCRYPQRSPAGDLLAYERIELDAAGQSQEGHIWLLELDERGLPVQPAKPVQVGDPNDQGHHPIWSPQGLLAYFDDQQRAFIIQDPKTGETDSFASGTAQAGSWDPSGRYYLISEVFSNPDPAPSTMVDLQSISASHLVRFDRQTGETQDLTNSDRLEDAAPAYSPDGTALAFTRKRLKKDQYTPGRQVWVMSASGEQARALTSSPDYNHYDLAWSPDGRQLAYVRFDLAGMNQPPEVWIVNADGSLAQRLISGGYSPRWLP